MAQSNRGKLVATFRYPIRVEVRRPKFARSASLAYIDVAKLARAARAEFEVGHFEAGCCRKAVLAVVRRGMVTALRVEACAECKPVRLTPELQAMINAARRRMGRRRERPFRPMTVVQFMGVAELIITATCSQHCITVWGHVICLFCCDFPSGRRECSITISEALE
ncbi:MAG TPA: hypothetical protein VFP86_18660 [bacterium]|nr:hypothetical protein [bacterium]